MCVAFKLKLTLAPLIMMTTQVHGTFPASMNSTLAWVPENNPLTDGSRVSTKCRRNPGFQVERMFLVRLILIFQPPSSSVHKFCSKKYPSILVFCSIYYCRDNIYDISLFGNCLPSESGCNKLNFYVYNLFGIIWC